MCARMKRRKRSGDDETVHDRAQQQCGIRWFTAHLMHATIETLLTRMSGRSIVRPEEYEEKRNAKKEGTERFV